MTFTTDKIRLLQSFLELSPHYPWDSLTPAMIAEHAGLPLDSFAPCFPDKTDLLGALVDWLDQEMEQLWRKEDTAPADRIFELFMSRFEIMQTKRAGLVALGRESRRTPEMAWALYKAHLKTMTLVLSLAYRSEDKSRHWPHLLTHSLLATHLLTCLVWERDESAGLESTMARLDHLLKALDKVGIFVAASPVSTR